MRAKKVRKPMVRMDERLYAALKKEAAQRGQTFASYVRFLLVTRHGIPSGPMENFKAPGPFYTGRAPR